MQLYKTTYKTANIAEPGTFRQAAVWHGSAADASKARTALKAENRKSDPSTKFIDVPVVKVGLLAFLNTLTI